MLGWNKASTATCTLAGAGLIHSLKSLKNQALRTILNWLFCYQGADEIDNHTYIYVLKCLFPSYPYR
jgi:hypothetical protein